MFNSTWKLPAGKDWKAAVLTSTIPVIGNLIPRKKILLPSVSFNKLLKCELYPAILRIEIRLTFPFLPADYADLNPICVDL